MICIIQGTVAAVKLKAPNQGQNFPAHNLISVSQINDGELEVIKVKDENLENSHPEGKTVAMKIIVNEWANNGRAGVSKKFVGYANNGASKS